MCKYIVFGFEHYNPLGIIRSLGENGIYPIYIAIKYKIKIASLSKYISKCHFVDSEEDGYKLLLDLYSDGDEKNYIFTSDDGPAQYFDENYDKLKDHFIFFNAGSSGRISKYINKDNIMELAKNCGLPVLDYVVVEKGFIPNDLSYPVITKAINPNVGGWKSDVFICKNENELKEAFQKIESPKVVIQKYLFKKNELALEGLSINEGKDVLITIESTYKYLIPGYYSPYMVVNKFKNVELYNKIKILFEMIHYEGIFEIEFLIDDNDNYYFLEINFRNSTWSYASTVAGMPLPYIWVESIKNGKIDEKYYNIDFEPFDAMVEPIDYQKRVVEKISKTSRFKWFKDFLRSKCKYYYNKRDLKPFFSMLKHNKKVK